MKSTSNAAIAALRKEKIIMPKSKIDEKWG